MGFFDKLFGFFKKDEEKKKKVKVKLITEDSGTDEHEQFLKKKKEPIIVTVGEDGTTAKIPEPQKPAKRKSEVVKITEQAPAPKAPVASAKPAVKITEEKKTEPKPKQKSGKEPPAKATTVKITIPKSEEAADDDSYTKGSVTVTEGKSTRNGKFDIQRAKDGRFFFNLYASNHTVIAYSQIYSSTSAAMNGINSIIANAAKSPIEDTTLKNPTSYSCPKWEIYIDRAGEYRFRLYASNGLQICHSAHGYSTKSGCKGGIDSIGRFASDAAKIDKSYLK